MTDKSKTQQMAAKLERKAHEKRSGIASPFEEEHQKPLIDHLADFDETLSAKGVADSHRKLVISRCRKIIHACHFDYIGHVSPSPIESFLRELRTEGTSVQTSNHYIRAIKQFMRWLVMDRRTNDNPLSGLATANVATDRRHIRRALTDDEIGKILKAAREGGQVLGVPAADREILYVVALYTGFRASELASMTPESFDLESNPPTASVGAKNSKRRRVDQLPIHPAIVEKLREWLASKPAKSPLWPGGWAKNRYAGKMLKRDLASAGVPFKDDQGRVADFHCFRHTFITRLVKSGAAPKVAQTLARHSDIRLTMNVYTHLGLHDQAAAIGHMSKIGESQPNEEPEDGDQRAKTLKITGTD